MIVFPNSTPSGLWKLAPGDYLFTRNELGSRDAHDDVAVAWVVGP